jgi:hypothetical protein
MRPRRGRRDLVEENATLARDNAELDRKLIEQKVKLEELTRARDEAIRARDAALERWEETMEELDVLRDGPVHPSTSESAKAEDQAKAGKGRFDPGKHPEARPSGGAKLAAPGA